MRRNLGRIEAWFRGKWKNGKEHEKEELDKRYRLRKKGFNIVMEIKQRIMAKASKVKRYTGKTKQFQHNHQFSSKQGKFFKTLDG